MLPRMCSHPACKNVPVTSVIKWRPCIMRAGITAQRKTNASPSINSRRNTYAFARMISKVTTAKRRGCRDASPSGIKVATLASLDDFQVQSTKHRGRRRPSFAAPAPHAAPAGAATFQAN